MSDEKTKVADLPQDEQDALINEAKELDVRGFYGQMKVTTLKAKIEEAKAAKANGENEQEPAADEQAPANDEQNTDNGEQNTDNGEQNTENDEQNTENDEQSNGENEQEPAADEPAADEKEEPAAPKVNKGSQRAYAKEKDAAPAKAKICHICRSKVVNGKCTGCGFELKI